MGIFDFFFETIELITLVFNVISKDSFLDFVLNIDLHKINVDKDKNADN